MSCFDISDFRIKDDDKDFSLLKFPTTAPGLYTDKDADKEKLERIKDKINDLQELLYAAGEEAALFVVQAMDAGGKDGMVRAVFSGMNPHGCKVTSFKQPTPMELKHGFMWRHDLALPEYGTIGVWNRSHYEEVGTVRVHPEFLKARNIDPSEISEKFWKSRLEQIKQWEAAQSDTGVHIVKIFLHISKAEQAERLLARAEDPAKHWKFNPGDLAERKLWDQYMEAYSEAIRATSTKYSPWYVIPADDKLTARLIVAEVVKEHLRGLDLLPPNPSQEREAQIASAVRELREEIKAANRI